MEVEKLPIRNYYLDESDPAIVILRRHDDSFVAAFSASGATMKDYRVAIEDYLATILAQKVQVGAI